MADDPASALPKQRGRPFQKGQSGNPKGRSPGTRCKATIMAERLIGDAAEKIVQTTIDVAMGGDTAALALLMKHILPARKGRPIVVALPPLTAAADVPKAMAAIVAAVAEGIISPEEGADLSAIVEAGRRAIETADFEQRLADLELHRERE